ncbi:helix-turn-helix domain-containing protein [Rickettsiales bacterium LUAb2]
MIGERLKQIRILNNISQEELASKLNMSLFEYNSYENDTVSIGIGTLMYIANVLNIEKISYFFNNE